MKVYIFFILFCLFVQTSCSYSQPEYNPIRNDVSNEGETDTEEPGDGSDEKPVDEPDIYPEEDYELVWREEFDEEVYNGESQEENRKILDERWSIQNAPSTHILCGRYRENVEVSDGTLKLINKKENRGGQEWTSGNIWTKEHFMYGYYECRYKYAAATGTNNSFWIMSQNSGQPTEGSNFELDINEGHFPCEVATNIHNWSGVHTTSSKKYIFGVQPENSIPMENPISTRKIRFSSNYYRHFHIKEFRVFNYIKGYIYPGPMENYDESKLTNFAGKATIKSSGNYQGSYPPQNAVDNNMSSSWVSQDEGEKWLEFDFGSNVAIGCIQFVNGYLSGDEWQDVITDYKIQYEKDGKWIDIVSTDVTKSGNFADEYHTYGLQWTKDELIFYFDRKEIRRAKNEFCYSPAPVWLSLAIISWSGPVTDAIDGTKMEVDYVRIYKKKD